MNQGIKMVIRICKYCEKKIEPTYGWRDRTQVCNECKKKNLKKRFINLKQKHHNL